VATEALRHAVLFSRHTSGNGLALPCDAPNCDVCSSLKAVAETVPADMTIPVTSIAVGEAAAPPRIANINLFGVPPIWWSVAAGGF
jgi:hypothetical protein